MTIEEKSFENIEGKRGNAGNKHFLLLQQYFRPNSKQISSFEQEGHDGPGVAHLSLLHCDSKV